MMYLAYVRVAATSELDLRPQNNYGGGAGASLAGFVGRLNLLALRRGSGCWVPLFSTSSHAELGYLEI